VTSPERKKNSPQRAQKAKIFFYALFVPFVANKIEIAGLEFRDDAEFTGLRRLG